MQRYEYDGETLESARVNLERFADDVTDVTYFDEEEILLVKDEALYIADFGDEFFGGDFEVKLIRENIKEISPVLTDRWLFLSLDKEGTVYYTYYEYGDNEYIWSFDEAGKAKELVPSGWIENGLNLITAIGSFTFRELKNIDNCGLEKFKVRYSDYTRIMIYDAEDYINYFNSQISNSITDVTYIRDSKIVNFYIEQ